jgi:hypothetical protein
VVNVQFSADGPKSASGGLKWLNAATGPPLKSGGPFLDFSAVRKEAQPPENIMIPTELLTLSLLTSLVFALASLWLNDDGRLT